MIMVTYGTTLFAQRDRARLQMGETLAVPGAQAACKEAMDEAVKLAGWLQLE